MAVELTPLGKFSKWVIVPVLVGLFGYYVLGPRYGGEIAKRAPKVGVFNQDAPDEGNAQNQPKPDNPAAEFKRIREAKK